MRAPRSKVLAVLALAALAAPAGWARHDEGCVPGEAPPGTYTPIETPLGDAGYLEHGPPPRLWEESNGLPGLQRGGIGLTGACVPPAPLPCLVDAPDPPADENCGHGPDTQVF